MINAILMFNPNCLGGAAAEKMPKFALENIDCLMRDSY